MKIKPSNLTPAIIRLMSMEDRRKYDPSFPDVHTNLLAVLNKRVRQDSKPLLNKLETEWLQESHKLHIAPIRPQAVRLKLANGVWYKPDFTVWGEDRLIAYECKGPKAVKGCAKGLMTLKLAASQYPEITFVLVWKEHGKWQQQRIFA